MGVLATAVCFTQNSFTAAVWIHGIGQLLGSFPATNAGAEAFANKLCIIESNQQTDGVYLLLEPSGGLEQTLVAAADQHGWQVGWPDPALLQRWRRQRGYSAASATERALMLARYAAEMPEDLVPCSEGQAPPAAALPGNRVELASRLRELPGRARFAIRTLVALLLRPEVLATLVIVVGIRLFDLSRLPGDLYGDIAIVLEYIEDIRKGNWPTSFYLSAGPLYHYLILPVTWVFGLTYIAAKVASVLVSLGILALTYALGRDLVDQRLGLLAAFIAGVSSWLLIFSRLGNSQILVPLLAVGALYCALWAVRRGSLGGVVACAVVSTLGLYVYPQSFILPGVMLLTLACLMWLGPGLHWQHLLAFVAVTLVCAVPFGFIVRRDPANFFAGYIGEKLPAGGELAGVFAGNMWRGLLALHIQGDEGFRSNPTLLPQFDVLSGLLFLGGVVFWLRPERRRLSPALFVPLLLLQLPALLVRHAVEVPSASRTLGITPMVYLLVASGLWWITQGLRSRPWLARVALLGALAAVLFLNSERYFKVYALGLPNRNVAFGQVIASYIDSLPPQTDALVIGCCWGQIGQPHPKAVEYAVSGPQRLRMIPQDQATCADIAQARRPAELIWSTKDPLPAPQLAPCMPPSPPVLHTSDDGQPVFQSVKLE